MQVSLCANARHQTSSVGKSPRLSDCHGSIFYMLLGGVFVVRWAVRRRAGRSSSGGAFVVERGEGPAR